VERGASVHLGIEQLSPIGHADRLAELRRVMDVVDLQQPEIADHLGGVPVGAVRGWVVPGFPPCDGDHRDEIVVPEPGFEEQLGDLLARHRHARLRAAGSSGVAWTADPAHAGAPATG
jgi:hypothetical protein